MNIKTWQVNVKLPVKMKVIKLLVFTLSFQNLRAIYMYNSTQLPGHEVWKVSLKRNACIIWKPYLLCFVSNGQGSSFCLQKQHWCKYRPYKDRDIIFLAGFQQMLYNSTRINIKSFVILFFFLPCPDDVWRIFDCSKHKYWASQRYSMTYRAWNQHA